MSQRRGAYPPEFRQQMVELVKPRRSLYEVQKLLGRHDPKVTMRCALLSPQAMLEAVDVVGNLMGRRSVVNQGATSVALA